MSRTRQADFSSLERWEDPHHRRALLACYWMRHITSVAEQSAAYGFSPRWIARTIDPVISAW
jgi:hypothetical protein